MNSYPHHLCRGNATFTATEDGFFTVHNGATPSLKVQLNSDDAFDLAIWLIKELKIQSGLPASQVY